MSSLLLRSRRVHAGIAHMCLLRDLCQRSGWLPMWGSGGFNRYHHGMDQRDDQRTWRGSVLRPLRSDPKGWLFLLRHLQAGLLHSSRWEQFVVPCCPKCSRVLNLGGMCTVIPKKVAELDRENEIDDSYPCPKGFRRTSYSSKCTGIGKYMKYSM